MLDVLVIKSPVWVIMCDTLYIDTVFCQVETKVEKKYELRTFFPSTIAKILLSNLRYLGRF